MAWWFGYLAVEPADELAGAHYPLESHSGSVNADRPAHENPERQAGIRRGDRASEPDPQ